MQEFSYTIKDSCGVHARPAGMLVKMAKGFGGTVTVACGEKQCEMKKLMALMSMGIKQGDTVKITVEGAGEEAFADELEQFLAANL